MTGKISLLLVMGFSLIFLVFGHNYNNASNGAVDNFAQYYEETITHDLANSGANIAANAIFLKSDWEESEGTFPLYLNGGSVDVRVDNEPNDIRIITSTARYEDKEKVVTVVLGPSSFSKYAYYSESEGNGIWWTNKDTVYGPFHTQSNLLCDNHPVFGYKGYRTTIKGKIVYHDYYVNYGLAEPTNKSTTTKKNAYTNSIKNDRPIFHGSFEDGVDEPLNLEGLQVLRDNAADNGLKIDSTTMTKTDSSWVCKHAIFPKHAAPNCGNGEWNVVTSIVPATVDVTFISDSVRIKVGNDAPETFVTEDIAPNGIIYAEGMDIKLSGVVDGRYSVVSDGDIYLVDDIIYNEDPKDKNAACNDVLGIISQNNVYIKDNNYTNDINIHGAIYCQNGGFGAENHDSRSIDGTINLYGGITQKIRRAVGTFSGNAITHGFNKSYRYDPRLATTSPPKFPTTKGFAILAWIE